MTLKHKKNIICMIAIGLLAIMSACGGRMAAPINLPEASDIEAVKIIQDNQVLEITDFGWITELIKRMSVVEATKKESIQDVPNVTEYIQIDLILKNNHTIITLFVYTEKEKWYVEQPYQGIYLADDAILKMIGNAD